MSRLNDLLLLADAPRVPVGMPPPTVEQRQCFTCHGDQWIDDGEFDGIANTTCPTCRGKGTLPVEVRR